ncbi:MAG: mannose-phosphate guanylyltransferase [Candidatus Saccharibacteria bacterium]|nr:mannose-phosphate guanylyltransferase [Candidatus Saccharibacteria bacterium]
MPASTPELSTTPVIVLCGGAGSRMTELTGDTRPKHLLRAGGRAVLEHAIEPLMPAGQIILATGNHADQIEAFVANTFDKDKVICSAEPRPLGVIGALSRILVEHAIDGQFIIANGDEITPGLDLSAMRQSHQHSGAELTVLTATKTAGIKDFSFTIDGGGRATSLRRTDELLDDESASNFGIGTFFCEQSAIDTMQASPDWTSFLRAMLQDRRLGVYVTDTVFYNLNRPADLQALA